jgi:Tfp pilus assembly protein PilV
VRARETSRGTTIVETTIAVAIFAAAFLGLITALLSSDSLRESSRERTLAYNAARRIIEQMRSGTFSQLFTNYSSGGTPGSTFTVERLEPISGQSVGTVSFPTVDSALREDVTDTLWGMPRDLNGDGTIDSGDHAADYELLPVRITVQWQSLHGPAKLTVETLIVDK